MVEAVVRVATGSNESVTPTPIRASPWRFFARQNVNGEFVSANHPLDGNWHAPIRRQSADTPTLSSAVAGARGDGDGQVESPGSTDVRDELELRIPRRGALAAAHVRDSGGDPVP